MTFQLETKGNVWSCAHYVMHTTNVQMTEWVLKVNAVIGNRDIIAVKRHTHQAEMIKSRSKYQLGQEHCFFSG